jgi:GxxExxY protein
MMTDLQKDRLTDKIVGCEIEVHRHLGPGSKNPIYEEAVCLEFDQQGLKKRIGEFRLPIS